jgi:hypothetical protein
MGFVPIFITLGGFIFLFVLLVHQNMRQKKSTFLSAWQDLELQIQQHPNAAAGKLDTGDLEAAEQAYRSFQESGPADAERPADANKVKKLLIRSKRARYEYNNLVRMKPYSFVAKLFGHRPL